MVRRDVHDLQLIANSIRKSTISMLAQAGSGHSAGPLGTADIFTALYFSVMHHDPRTPWHPERDRLVLSNGHIVPILYATLAEAGYFSKDLLTTLRKNNTKLQGHPHIRSVPGIENSAGPLAQGISIACGMALAAKMDKKKFHVYCSMGDGELNEGQVWEAFMFAAKYKLDNLTVFVDRNFIQIDGNTEEVMPLTSLKKKMLAFNWHVQEINGNNMNQILTAFSKAKKTKGAPSVIIAKTVPGKGVSYMEHKYEWHGKPPTKEQAKIALQELQTTRKKIVKEMCTKCNKHLHVCSCLEGE